MPMAVEILAPAGMVFETDHATLLAAPGAGGDLEIEPGHINLVTTLKIGRMRLRVENEDRERIIAVHGGFLEATPESVRVLADAAEPAEEINLERAREARRRAERRLEQRKADVDMARAEAALERALVRLNVAEGDEVVTT